MARSVSIAQGESFSDLRAALRATVNLNVEHLETRRRESAAAWVRVKEDYDRLAGAAERRTFRQLVSRDSIVAWSKFYFGESLSRIGRDDAVTRGLPGGLDLDGFHGQLLESIHQTFLTRSKMAVAAFRGSGKSILMCQLFPLYLACFPGILSAPGSMTGGGGGNAFAPQDVFFGTRLSRTRLSQLALVCLDEGLAVEHMRRIEDWLGMPEGVALQEDFPHLRRFKRSGLQMEFMHDDGRRFFSMTGFGMKTGYRGRHSAMIIDDPEDTDTIPDYARKPRKRNADAFNNLIQAVGDNPMVLVGTYLHPEGILPVTVKAILDGRKPDNWFLLSYGAGRVTGHPIWPQMWDLNSIENILIPRIHAGTREEQEAIYNREYENDLTGTVGHRVFDRRNFTVYRDGEIMEGGGYTTLGCFDPAGGAESGGDYNAYVQARYYRETRNIQVTQIYLARGSDHDFLNWWANLALTPERPDVVYIERLNAYANALRHYRHYLMESCGLPPESVCWRFIGNRNKNKEARARQVSYMTADGRKVFWPSGKAHLLSILEQFPEGDTDDLVDAFVYLLTAIQDLESGQFKAAAAPNRAAPGLLSRLLGPEAAWERPPIAGDGVMRAA